MAVPPAVADPSSRPALRAALRAARHRLAAAERQDAARQVAAHLAATGWLRPGGRIAGFVAMPEEIDPSPCLELALRRGCEVVLPRLTAWRSGRMVFAPIGPRRRINRYGIPEPDTTERIGARWLDLILVPLVGFDEAGNRLGMGAGFYDRALAFRRLRDPWRGPRLVGIAHSVQQVAGIPAAAHDVPLDAVITERGINSFRRRGS